MRIALVSKACLVGIYQRKLEELAALPDIDLTVIVPPYWRDERGMLTLEREHVDGYQLIVEAMRFNGNFHLHYYPHIARHLDTLHPDLIHIDEEPYNLATYHLMRIARRINARTLFFSWQNLNRRYPFPFNQIERSVLRQADACIAGNRDSADIWRAKGFSGPIAIIPQFGVDPDLFHPATPAHNQRPFTIGYVGRFVKEKGPDLLLHALAALKGDWCAEFVGSGPMHNKLVQLTDQLALRERVTFRDWMPSSQLPALYRTLDVLVLPSRTQRNWKEQFGRTLIEAMASGVPVLGSTCGEIPHVIGDTGLIFKENDVEGLRAQLTRLLNKPDLRADLARLGRQRVLEHYTQKQIANETAAVYREVLNKS